MGVGLGCGGVSLTCHMPGSTLRLPSRNTSLCFCTVMVVAVNVAVHPSSHICHTDISAPDQRWGKMWAVFPLVDSKGIRLSSTLWVACIRLPSGRITRCPCVVLTLFPQGVSTLM